MAAPLMTSHIDVSSEKKACEDFITHSKEVCCIMDEVSQEFDNFYDSVKKICSDNIEFNPEKQPCEDFVTHSKEVCCTMDEVSHEFDKFYDSVIKNL